MMHLTTVSPSAWNVSVGGFLFSRLKRQLPVFAPLGVGLLIITLLTAWSGLWQYQYELKHQSAKALTGSTGTAALQKNIAVAGSTASVQHPAASNSYSSVNTPVSGHKATSTAGSSPSSGQPPAAAPASNVSLSLSVNNQAKGTVRLAAGSTQCDVLSQALAEGLISSLDMRYSSQYGTEAVYVINGIGDPGTVWWTYTVNGAAPPYGCGYVTAHSGDSVNWQYIKS
jgi:hypothetical protein